jgi:hypothetical protein
LAILAKERLELEAQAWTRKDLGWKPKLL